MENEPEEVVSEPRPLLLAQSQEVLHHADTVFGQVPEVVHGNQMPPEPAPPPTTPPTNTLQEEQLVKWIQRWWEDTWVDAIREDFGPLDPGTGQSNGSNSQSWNLNVLRDLHSLAIQTEGRFLLVRIRLQWEVRFRMEVELEESKDPIACIKALKHFFEGRGRLGQESQTEFSIAGGPSIPQHVVKTRTAIMANIDKNWGMYWCTSLLIPLMSLDFAPRQIHRPWPIGWNTALLDRLLQLSLETQGELDRAKNILENEVKWGKAKLPTSCIADSLKVIRGDKPAAKDYPSEKERRKEKRKYNLPKIAALINEDWGEDWLDTVQEDFVQLNLDEAELEWTEWTLRKMKHLSETSARMLPLARAVLRHEVSQLVIKGAPQHRMRLRTMCIRNATAVFLGERQAKFQKPVLAPLPDGATLEVTKSLNPERPAALNLKRKRAVERRQSPETPGGGPEFIEQEDGAPAIRPNLFDLASIYEVEIPEGSELEHALLNPPTTTAAGIPIEYRSRAGRYNFVFAA